MVCYGGGRDRNPRFFWIMSFDYPTDSSWKCWIVHRSHNLVIVTQKHWQCCSLTQHGPLSEQLHFGPSLLQPQLEDWRPGNTETGTKASLQLFILHPVWSQVDGYFIEGSIEGCYKPVGLLQNCCDPALEGCESMIWNATEGRGGHWNTHTTTSCFFFYWKAARSRCCI